MSELGQATRAEQQSYDLPGTDAVARIGSLPAGSNLLIAGPTRTRKRRLALQLLAHGERARQPAIVLSTDRPASRLLEEFSAVVDDGLPPTYVVDCTGRRTETSIPDAARVEWVGSPGDLTGIAVGVAKCMQAIGDDATEGLRLAHVSLSSLLQHTTEDRVFEFAHVVSGRISAGGYLGVWTLDTDSHEATTVNTMRGRFEYVAEIREDEDGRREMRVLGGPDEWRRWEVM